MGDTTYISPATMRACAVDRRKAAMLLESAGRALASGDITTFRELCAEAHIEGLVMECAMRGAQVEDAMERGRR